MMLTISSNLRQAIIKTAIEEAPRIQLENIAALEKKSQTRTRERVKRKEQGPVEILERLERLVQQGLGSPG